MITTLILYTIVSEKSMSSIKDTLKNCKSVKNSDEILDELFSSIKVRLKIYNKVIKLNQIRRRKSLLMMRKMKVIMKEVMSRVRMTERNTKRVRRRKRNTRKRRKNTNVVRTIVRKEMLSLPRK